MTFSPKQMSQRVTLSVGENCLNKPPTNSTCFLKKALGALNFRNFSFPNSLGGKLLKLVLPKWRKLTGFFRQLKNFCQSCCLRFLSVPRRSWCSTSRWTSADGRKLLRDESRQVRKFQEHMNAERTIGRFSFDWKNCSCRNVESWSDVSFLVREWEYIEYPKTQMHRSVSHLFRVFQFLASSKNGYQCLFSMYFG